MSIKNKHSCNLKLALLFFVHTKSCFANNYSLELNVWLEEVKKKHPIIKAIQHLAICHSLPNMYIVPSVDELCHFSYSLLQWRREILFLLIWAHNHKTNSLPLFKFQIFICTLHFDTHASLSPCWSSAHAAVTFQCASFYQKDSTNRSWSSEWFKKRSCELPVWCRFVQVPWSPLDSCTLKRCRGRSS